MQRQVNQDNSNSIMSLFSVLVSLVFCVPLCICRSICFPRFGKLLWFYWKYVLHFLWPENSSYSLLICRLYIFMMPQSSCTLFFFGRMTQFHPLHLLLCVWAFPLTFVCLFLVWQNFPHLDSFPIPSPTPSISISLLNWISIFCIVFIISIDTCVLGGFCLVLSTSSLFMFTWWIPWIVCSFYSGPLSLLWVPHVFSPVFVIHIWSWDLI